MNAINGQAIEQTSGRQRINIHGAIDLETGQTRMIEALTIDAASTIRLLESIELACHHPGSRIGSSCPIGILNPIRCKTFLPILQ